MALLSHKKAPQLERMALLSHGWLQRMALLSLAESGLKGMALVSHQLAQLSHMAVNGPAPREGRPWPGADEQMTCWTS